MRFSKRSRSSKRQLGSGAHDHYPYRSTRSSSHSVVLHSPSSLLRAGALVSRRDHGSRAMSTNIINTCSAYPSPRFTFTVASRPFLTISICFFSHMSWYTCSSILHRTEFCMPPSPTVVSIACSHIYAGKKASRPSMCSHCYYPTRTISRCIVHSRLTTPFLFSLHSL